MEPESLLIGSVLLGDDEQQPSPSQPHYTALLRPEPISRPTRSGGVHTSVVFFFDNVFTLLCAAFHVCPSLTSRRCSAPPSFRAFGPDGDAVPEPAEQYRSDPQYLEYYYAHKALNPRYV